MRLRPRSRSPLGETGRPSSAGRSIDTETGILSRSLRGALAPALGVVVAGACGAEPTVGGLPVAPRCAIERPAPGRLSIAGGAIVDELGRRVALRGVNTGGRAKRAPYAPFDFADGGYDAALATYLDRAASWGIDALRVVFSWQAAEPTAGSPDEAYLARFDALLDGAWARGMWTIIDFHQDLYAEPYCGDGFPAWTLTPPPEPRQDCERWFNLYNDSTVKAAFDAFWAEGSPARAAYDALWQRLADRHRDRPGVIGYEPINEPHWGTASQTTWEATTLTTFFTDMAALLGERDPDGLVFVDLPGIDGVSGETTLERPVGDRIVLAPHSYDPNALFGGSLRDNVKRRLQPWADLGAAWGVPVLIGEMGVVAEHPQAAVHLRRHLAAMDALGLHGTWWEYSVSPELWNGENLSVVDASGADTPMVDELARPYPRALAGEVVTSEYDPDLRLYALEYHPSGDAPTEIPVPARWGEVRIGADGGCVDLRDGHLLVKAAAGADVVRVAVERAPESVAH